MNKRTLVISLALTGLGVALAALPGSSAKTQEPRNSSLADLQAKAAELAAQAQQVSASVSSNATEELEDALQEVQQVQASDGQDFELFLGDGSWLGVEAKEVTGANVKQFKLSAERGALVGKIIPDSPAAKAGLKENDVITEINGQRVEGAMQFRRMIREIPAGRTAQLTVMRDGRSQSVSVTLAKSEQRNTIERLRVPSPGAFSFRVPDSGEMEAEGPQVLELGDLNHFSLSGMGQPRLGIDAEDLRGELGEYFGAPEGKGVLVRSVAPDSPAAKAGLKSGDVITALNGQRVRNIAELREQMRGSKEEKSLKVGLLRNKSEMSLNVVLPAPVKKEIHSQGERATM
jgi:C-terminal processing protease CtpA/Prc